MDSSSRLWPTAVSKARSGIRCTVLLDFAAGQERPAASWTMRSCATGSISSWSLKTNPEVERWFAEKKLPAEATIRRVREIILRADRQMTEFVQYGTLTFGYDGDFATFVQVSKKQASVMFNRGARIP